MKSNFERRLEKVEAEREREDLPRLGEGLSGLLRWAQTHPRPVVDPDAPLTGLGRLLQEARREHAMEQTVNQILENKR